MSECVCVCGLVGLRADAVGGKVVVEAGRGLGRVVEARSTSRSLRQSDFWTRNASRFRAVALRLGSQAPSLVEGRENSRQLVMFEDGLPGEFNYPASDMQSSIR